MRSPCYIWWVGGVRSVVAEINRNGTAFFWYVTLMAVVAFLVSLNCTVKEKGCGFSDGSVARRYAGACTGDIPGKILPAPAAPLGRLSQSSFDAPRLTENINPTWHCDPGSSPDAVNIHFRRRKHRRGDKVLSFILPAPVIVSIWLHPESNNSEQTKRIRKTCLQKTNPVQDGVVITGCG